jgi:spore coat protein CotH
MEVSVKKKTTLVLILCILICSICSLDGCGKSNSSSSGDVDKEDNSTTVSSKVDVDEDEELYEQLFDINNTISIQIQISQEELDKIQADYEEYDSINSKSPIYRKADKVTITVGDAVYEIEEVGIRLKGNTSRVPVYDEDTGNLNLSHYRLSFNETFDDETYYGEDAQVWSSEEERQARKDRRFAGLKGMEIKWNKNYDNTHIREIYAYEIFRDFGVYAQRVNLCSLCFNGENYGVVNIYEPVDQIFIERNLPEEDWGGDLYKCAWTYKPANYVDDIVTYGVEDPDSGQFYNYDLKTNKEESNFETLEQLLSVVNSDSLTKEEFESVVDTEYLENFLAVSYFMGNPDDMRNNYNNHYVYFLKSSGKAIFIPYDYDRCLGITYGWNPDGTGMTYVSPYSEDAESMGTPQTNPIINSAVINDDAYCLEGYSEALEKIATSDWLTEDKFLSYYNVAKENYEEVVTPTVDFENVDEDQFGFNLDGEYTSGDESNMSFNVYIEELLECYHKTMYK